MQGSVALVKKDQTFVMGVDETFGDIYELDMRDGTQQMSGDQTILSASTAADLDADVGTSLPMAFPGGRRSTSRSSASSRTPRSPRA